jgi:hypothetical protein
VADPSDIAQRESYMRRNRPAGDPRNDPLVLPHGSQNTLAVEALEPQASKCVAG